MITLRRTPVIFVCNFCPATFEQPLRFWEHLRAEHKHASKVR